jgi:hypothetical protein
MKRKSGNAANTIHGDPSGGGGADSKGVGFNTIHDGTAGCIKKGLNANTIHGNPSGGGGIDSKGLKANTVHGDESGGGGVDSKGFKANTVKGPGRASASRPKSLTGKMNRRMY